MKRLRIIGLALVAVFAMGAVVAATASAALPEYQEEAGGVIKPQTKKIAFKGEAGVSKLVSAAATIECASDSSKGDILSSTEWEAGKENKQTGKIKITYEKCTSPTLGGVSCETKKTKPGEIITEDLTGVLVYATETEGGTPEVATQLFTPESGTVFAKFSCDEEELPVSVTGSVIGEVKPINHAAPLPTEGEVILRSKVTSIAGCGRQQFLFVNGLAPCHHLEALGEPAWNVTTETVTYGAKKVDVKA